MSLFDTAYEMARARIQSTDAWRTFDAARKKSVRKALREAVETARQTGEGRAEAGDRLLAARAAPLSVDAVTDEHLAAVAAAGLPLVALLKMFGISTLLKLASALDGGDDEKKGA